MKRKITDLEQRLLDKGYVLSCKTYTKKRNRIESYVYQKIVDDEYIINVVLDPYRNHIMNYGFKKMMVYFDLESMARIKLIYEKVTKEITEIDIEPWVEDDFTEEVEEVLKGECEDESRE